MRRFALFLAPLLLASCGPADNEPGPGGVTVGEAKALDEAAEMLEQRRRSIEEAGANAEPPKDASIQPPPQAAN
ncbi:hypothetical protein V5F89_04305 [Pelagerythrobacter marensis]|uniref:Argininosuccinate lyase n=1 Tax=Pelagerythrobacter marensis TaxID=543877 RepID=A0ABZ2D526_9SPHN